MNNNVIVLIGQMEIIASLMVIGFFEQKIKLFDDRLIDSLSAIMSKLILPCMLITVIGSISREELFSSWRFFVCSVAAYIVVIAISKFVAIFSGLKEPQRSMHALLCCFGNSGFIGIPLIVSMFPTSAGIAAASFSLIESTLYWVFGPLLIKSENGGKKIDIKKIVTPLTISVIIGFVIVLLDFDFDGFVLWDIVKDVGGTSKYFASIYIGMNLGRMGIKKVSANMRVFLTAPFKLIIFPVMAYIAVSKIGALSGDILTMYVVLFATPAGMTLPILANISGADGDYASAGCMVSTVLCLFTMPFVIWLTGII